MIQETFVAKLHVPGDLPLPVPTVLTYLAVDPMAVEIHFQVAGDSVRWMIARTLLADGCKDDSGEGDVRIWPGTEPGDRSIYLSLSSPEGEALVELNRDVVEKFLFDTYGLVAAGAETVDVDKFLAELFSA